METFRSKKSPQLWRASIWCPIHGKSKIPMLPPLACPGCDSDRRNCDLLRRSKSDNKRRERGDDDYCRSLEEDASDKR